MSSPDKPWDFDGPTPERGREADLHVNLSDDVRYARQHEALRRVASLLVEAVDDAVERMRDDAVREGHEPMGDVEAVFDGAREYHVRKVAGILLDEAVRRWATSRKK